MSLSDRCMFVSPNGDRCGCIEGHTGLHNALVDTFAPWKRGDLKNKCGECGRRVKLRKDGTYPFHATKDPFRTRNLVECRASAKKPSEVKK